MFLKIENGRVDSASEVKIGSQTIFSNVMFGGNEGGLGPDVTNERL